MSNLLATAENLLIDRILSDDSPFSGKSKARLGLSTLAGLLLAVALGFFIYASYIWMTSNYPPETAAIMAGGLTLLTSCICSLSAYAIAHYKRTRIKQMKQDMTKTMQNALEMADDELSQPIKDNPKTAILIASLAGFIAGEKLI